MQHHRHPAAPDIAQHRAARKTADQIQAEIDLMRLAYREQLDAESAKPRMNPMLKAVPYLASVVVMVLGVIWLIFKR